MNIEQKAIKAVANVAAQAYRRAFDVKPDMTTGALAVMVDAIAALDQPTLAPKVDKEDVIWRAIGSLAQRVRDLEKPTPAPEPPLVGVSNGKDTIWHDPEVRMVNGIDKCPTCLGTGKVVRLEPVKEEPEASQPLPTEVEALIYQVQGSMGTIPPNYWPAINEGFNTLRTRLASLWPKAGQVPSVHSPLPWRLEEDVMGCKNVVDVNGDEVFSTPGLNNEAVDKGNVELILAVVNSRTAQPSPVTAEKLAVGIKAAWYKHMGEDTDADLWLGVAEAILQAFPLGQGRLTREQIVKAMREGLNVWERHGGEAIQRQADALLALQGPMTVSKEQWEKLVSRLESRHVILQPAIVFKAWLKAEFGMEVAE